MKSSALNFAAGPTGMSGSVDTSGNPAPSGHRFPVSGPPLSGHYFRLCKDSGGCDVGTSGFAIDVALGGFGFGTAFAGGDCAWADVACEGKQPFGQIGWID